MIRERYKYFCVLQNAINVYKAEHQQVVAIEELSELQKELTKMLRGIGRRENLIEELADVEIVLDQIRLIYGIGINETKEVKYKKIKRLEERIALIMKT